MAKEAEVSAKIEPDNWRARSDKMRCRFCMFWVRKDRYNPTVVGALDLGRCRRRAPTLAGWPAVFETDWCGDHKLDEEKI